MSESATIRVLVLAAYPAVRAGLRSMLDTADDIDVTMELIPEAVELGGEFDGDVLVADLGDDPERILAVIEDLAPGLPAVLLGDSESFEGFGHPTPRAYLLRDASAEELVAAVRAVEVGLVVLDPSLAHARADPADGEPDANLGAGRLTERELEVLRLIALGLPNKGIALRLAISEHTVKFHVGAILSRLGAASRTEAVMLAARRGLLPL